MRASVESDEPSMVGSTLCDTYRITAKIGVGAMGTVYDAEHVRLKRSVAVKILAARFRDHVAALKRFHNEARALVMLDNPHVVRIVDFAMTPDGRPFLVMERLHGKTVGQHLESRRTFSVARTIAVARHVCEALVEAHSKGVFHRDLKPDNLFLVDAPGAEDFVKVLDFGISRVPNPDGSRVTAEREVIGTPEYMSPEQALGLSDRVNGRADQYGLALVMYEMLSGVSPFASDDVEAALEKVSFEMPQLVSRVAPGVPVSLAKVLHRALSKDPQERYGGIDVFLDAAVAASGEPSEASRESSDDLRPSVTVGQSLQAHDPVRAMALLLSRMRAAMLGGEAIAAVKLAGAVIDSAALSNDLAVDAVLELSRSLLEGVFQSRLEPLERRITVVAADDDVRQQGEPRAALLNAAKAHGTIAELLHAVAVPRLDALRALVDLEAEGVIEFVGVPRPRSLGPLRAGGPVSHRAPVITLKRA